MGYCLTLALGDGSDSDSDGSSRKSDKGKEQEEKKEEKEDKAEKEEEEELIVPPKSMHVPKLARPKASKYQKDSLLRHDMGRSVRHPLCSSPKFTSSFSLCF